MKWLRRAVFVILLLLYTIMAAQAAEKNPEENKKYLIEWSWGNHDTPAYITSHTSFIESMPFDGMVINNYPGRNFISSQKDSTPGSMVWSRKSIASGFVPLYPGTFKKFTQNFAKVNMGMLFNPPPLSDDERWKKVVASAENFAAVVKSLGLKGIYLDNEIYSGVPYWEEKHLPRHLRFSHAEQARARGQQMMHAFMKGYPDIVLIVAHSPAESCEESPADLFDYRNPAYLSGYFFSGMALEVHAPALLVDGGEVYHWRSDEDFARAYQWRKYGIAASTCKVVPDSLKPDGWAKRVSIGFGIMDRPVGEQDSVPMNAAIARTTIENALRHADAYVWHYSEKRDWWSKPKDKGDIPLVSDEWKQAVESAHSSRKEK